MRLMKLTLRIFGALVALLAALPVVLIACLHVQPGRDFVSSLVSSLASSDTQTITVEGLYVSFGLNAQIDAVRITDTKGPWFDAETLKLSWHPLQLLAGHLEITGVSARRIDLNRRPAPNAASDAPGSETATPTESGFSVPVDITVRGLKLEEVNLGAALIGEPVSLTASGDGSFAPDPALLRAYLDVRRVDGVAAELTARAEFEPAAETLTFQVALSEPRGGLAARLLDVPNLPALSVDLEGQGPLSDWGANLAVALDGHRTVTGSAKLQDTGGGSNLTFDLDGDLAPLVPPQARAFVLGSTKASGAARFSPVFEPLSAKLSLKTQTVSLEGSGALTNGEISANGTLSVTGGDAQLIALDLGDKRVALGPLSADVSVSGALSQASWTTRLTLASLQSYEAKIEGLSLNLSGKEANLTPDALSSPFDLDLTVSDLQGLIPATEPLTGPLSLKGAGTLDGKAQTLEVSDLALAFSAASLSLSDTLASTNKVSGQGRLSVPDLKVFSNLAGRDLGGAVSTSFSVDLDPQSLAGSTTVALVADALKTGLPQADGLLSQNTRLDAVLDLKGTSDITLKSLALKNDALTLSGTARYQSGALTSSLTAALEDLARIDPQLDGTLNLTAKTAGPVGALQVEAKATSKQILLAGTPLDGLEFSVKAISNPAAPSATVTTTARLNGQPISVDVDLKSQNGGADIDPLSVKLAGNTVQGALKVGRLDNALETLAGTLKIDAPDLASLSPLLLTEIDGQLQGSVFADPDAKKLVINLSGGGIAVPSVKIGSLTLKADIAAPYTPQTVSANIALSSLVTDATPVHEVKLLATPERNGTSFTADVRVDPDNQDGLSLAAFVTQPSASAYRVDLSKLSMTYLGLASQLKAPATLSYADGTAVLTPLDLQLGGGSLAVSGSAGDTLDLTAKLTDVPLDLANAFVPSLGLGGALSGTVSATGSAAAPQAQWTISGAGLTASELKKNGLAALSLKSSGSLKDNTITQDTVISTQNGLKLTAVGTVGLAQPNMLAVTLNGTVPVATLRRPLLEAGLRGDGVVSLSGKVSGSATAPVYQITATPAGLQVTSLSTGLTLKNIQGTASVTQDQASLNGISGDLATGGSLAASGTVGMKDGFPADLSLKLNNGRYVDPGLVTADVTADIKITGPLASPSNSALIGGTVTINKADVSIPEYLPGAIPPVDVQHVNASAAVRQQVADLGGEPKQSQAQQKSVPPRLDILLSAPGRIFIRGRGLDTELQGSLKVAGTTADPQAIGAFSLKRGQLDILNRRLVFSRGSATFDGSLTPLIDFVATTSVNSTTITVTVSGEADDPQIAFSSSPELPQDEVLALLLFGKSVGNLSATQVASLAAAISTLTGGSDSGPLASIRKSLGLDAIDINTDGEDGPSVAVGKYINDNIYLGVEQGTGSNSSRVKVDIDLDRGLKVRGEVGADGSSKAGIFFEREY